MRDPLRDAKRDPNRRDDGRLLASQASKLVCWACWGPVRLLCEDGRWFLRCAKDEPCEPTGFVSGEWAYNARIQNRLDAAKVAAAYPELVPGQRRLTPAEREAVMTALWGERLPLTRR